MFVKKNWLLLPIFLKFWLLIKGTPPIYWSVFSPDLSISQGGQNSCEKGGYLPKGRKKYNLNVISRAFLMIYGRQLVGSPAKYKSHTVTTLSQNLSLQCTPRIPNYLNYIMTQIHFVASKVWGKGKVNSIIPLTKHGYENNKQTWLRK